MRDLDKRAIMTGDFLVVYGDVVSNFPLDAALAEHRARRAVDKNAIMTMVLREAGAQHRTKAQGSSPVFVVDPGKKRCVHYEQMNSSAEREHSHIELDPEILASHAELELRNDLIDCGIDICTPDVLALWSDNFDYEAPRKGFLHSVLKDYELNGKTIHTYVVDDHYAARVRNLHGYQSVSRDVVARWVYPVCPDSNLMDDQTYRLSKGNIFTEEEVKVSRSAVVGPKTVIGSRTSIGSGSKVSDSVIGRNCSIGKNCKIVGAYVWDNTVIGDGTELDGCVVASDVVVGKHCRVLPGALISYGVKLSDGILVQKQGRITKAKRRKGEFQQPKDAKVVGESGEGYEYEPSDDDDEDDDAAAGILGLSAYPWCSSCSLTAPLTYSRSIQQSFFHVPRINLNTRHRYLGRRTPSTPSLHSRQFPQHCLGRESRARARRELPPRRCG